MPRELTITTVLFDPLEKSAIPDRSRVYQPFWVDRLYRGCKKHMPGPFRFVCLTHYPKEAFEEEAIEVVPFLEDTREVMCLTEVFRSDLEIDLGLFIALDSVLIGDVSFFREYEGDFALPLLIGCKDLKGRPLYYNPIAVYRGEAAAPLWDLRHRAYEDEECLAYKEFGVSEMFYWARHIGFPIDDVHELWPLKVTSYQWWRKGRNRRGDSQPAPPERVAEEARLVYFFGVEKQHNTKLLEVKEHWI